MIHRPAVKYDVIMMTSRNFRRI